jgi:hypothetical protein
MAFLTPSHFNLVPHASLLSMFVSSSVINASFWSCIVSNLFTSDCCLLCLLFGVARWLQIFIELSLLYHNTLCKLRSCNPRLLVRKYVCGIPARTTYNSSKRRQNARAPRSGHVFDKRVAVPIQDLSSPAATPSLILGVTFPPHCSPQLNCYTPRDTLREFSPQDCSHTMQCLVEYTHALEAPRCCRAPACSTRSMTTKSR